jgi:hypothetical protein
MYPKEASPSTDDPPLHRHFDAPSFLLGPEFEENDPPGPTMSIPPQTLPISPLGPSPPRKSMRTSSPPSPLAATRIRSGEFLFNKRKTGEINLNDLVVELEFTQTPVNRKEIHEGKIICPPRETSWPTCPRKKEAATRLLKWASSTAGDNNRCSWNPRPCLFFKFLLSSWAI